MKLQFKKKKKVGRVRHCDGSCQTRREVVKRLETARTWARFARTLDRPIIKNKNPFTRCNGDLSYEVVIKSF